jgi:hypothetical protein
MIVQHLSTFAGKPVADFRHEHEGDGVADHYPAADGATIPLAAQAAWRIGTWFDGPEFSDVFTKFLDEVDTAEVTHLVIGYWGADYDTGAVDPVRSLAEAAERLPALRALFLGDVILEQAEISWIEQSDITPLFGAFPGLEHLEVRGGQGLALDPVTSPVLKTLRMESGGLPAAVVRAVGASDLPALERLDLWLGVDDYGGDSTVADLEGILGGARLPSLRHLGLEDSGIQDEIAAAVAGAPIVARLETLSLAMGTLSDQGAEALLSGQPLTHLDKLDLHHHYLSQPMIERIRAALPDVLVNLEDAQDPEKDWRYVEVAE